jgi:hypothetical protein
MSELSEVEKKYGVTVAGLYKSQSGKTYSGVISDKGKKGQRDISEIADLIANGIGGKFVVELVKDEVKEEKGDKFPDAFIKFYDADSVAQQKAEWQSKKGGF